MCKKILVGIPTLNGPDRLHDCLNSIYATHDMYESVWDENGKEHRRRRDDILIVALDDCSTEENLEKNKKICAKFGIELLMHTERLGVAAGWNNLINYCESEYCILLNDDIVVAHNWSKCVVYTLENNSQIGIVGLNAYEGENSDLPSNNIPTYIESKILLGGKLSPILSARGFAFGFRKADYVALEGFDRRFFCFFDSI
jgi:GT2 family glycosyltransferase